MIVANAGVPRPILVRQGEIQEIKIEGTPLGMFPDIDYETVTRLADVPATWLLATLLKVSQLQF